MAEKNQEERDLSSRTRRRAPDEDCETESNIKCICSSRYRPGTASRAECGFRRNESSNARPLHGVPISIKSSFGVEGLRCEAGTRLRAGFVARQDAVLVTRLKNAGAIILGLTNTPELLMAVGNGQPAYGRTNSPWTWKRTPGGSSGGEAAAIAAGLSAGGVGSDRRRFDSSARPLSAESAA